MKHFGFLLLCYVGTLFLSCKQGAPNIESAEKVSPEQTEEARALLLDRICHPNMDTILLWEKGEFLNRQTSNRNYKAILEYYCHQDSLSARDIEKIYPVSVEEMNWFYSQLMSKDTMIQKRMRGIDDLMTFYADQDSLSCLPKFLNMYFVMDPQVIDRDWMGHWNLDRAMYDVIAFNKKSFKSYYDTLNKKYEWMVREWLWAYLYF